MTDKYNQALTCGFDNISVRTEVRWDVDKYRTWVAPLH
jgi:hypothetical protein